MEHQICNSESTPNPNTNLSLHRKVTSFTSLPFVFPSKEISSICQISEKNLIFLASGPKIYAWDISLQSLSAFPLLHSDSITSLKTSSDTLTLISCSKDSTVILWDILHSSCKVQLKKHSQIVRDASLTSNSETLVSVGDDRKVIITELKSGYFKVHSVHSLSIACVCIAPDDRLFITASEDKTIRLWDFIQCIRVVSQGCFCVFSLCISPDSRFIFLAEKNKRIWKFPLEDGNSLAGSRLEWSCTKIVHSPDCKFIIGACHDNCARIWDFNDLALVFVVTGFGNSVSDVCVRDDGRIAYLASLDGTIVVFDLENMTSIYIIGGHSERVTAVTSSDDLIVTGGSDKTIRIWDRNKKTCRRILRAHSGQITGLAIGGNLLISSDRKQIIVWDSLKELIRYKIKNVIDVGIRRDLKYCCAIINSNYLVWDLSNNIDFISNRHKFKILLMFRGKFKLK